MDIQATISKLQSDIKRNGTYIEWLERRKKESLLLQKKCQRMFTFGESTMVGKKI